LPIIQDKYVQLTVNNSKQICSINC
jgi:hypothetical protein